MELKDIHRVYFIGIGGIGMSALARYFAAKGCVVCGYDKTRTRLTSTLEREGMLISYLDDESSLPVTFLETDESTLIVFTPAIPKSSAILEHFRDNGFCLKKRSEVLGMISRDMFCIAVAGTHGKTTTSAIIAHILTATGYGCTAFLGGIATNYNNNLLLGKNNVMVVEADEYDRSFLTLHPDIAVITSMDADHLDIYGDENNLQESFRAFSGQIKPGGKLFARKGLDLTGSISYAANEEAAVKAGNIRVDAGCFVFDYSAKDIIIKDIRILMAGVHNVENTVAAITAALELGIGPEKIKAAVAGFKGVKRRFEVVLNTPQHVYVDDYAHHPAELKACFDAIRMLHPGKKLTVIFQPHLFSRTRDFAEDFAKVLSTADTLILLEIYPARELPIAGIDAQFLLNKVTLTDKQICGKESLKDCIKTKNPELLLSVGAGDIDTMVEPLKYTLEHV